MNKKLIGLVGVVILIGAGVYLWLNRSSINTSVKIESVYTDLITEKGCKYRDVDEMGGGSIGDCRGVGNLKIQIIAGDERESMTLIDQNEKEYPLNFTETITQAFSSIGNQAEWRVKKIGAELVPLAIIVPINAFENLENPEEQTHYIAVAKITPNEICVVAKIQPQPNQNEKAREIADHSASMPCLLETSDWKSYRNEEYRFEFKYPSNAISILNQPKISQCDIGNKSVATCKIFTSGIVVAIVNSKLNGNVINKYNDYPTGGNPPENVASEILIGGENSYEYDLVSAVNYKIHGIIVPIDGNHFLEIWENSKYPATSVADWKKIISTFKFLE